MQVKFRTNLGRMDAEKLKVDFSDCTVDAVVDVPDAAGEALCKAGIAELPVALVTPGKRDLKAVPAKAETAKD